MTLETMLLRENGGMVSQCAVSCVLECVLMLGTWNKTGEAWKLGQNKKKVQASKIFIVGMFYPPCLWCL